MSWCNADVVLKMIERQETREQAQAELVMGQLIAASREVGESTEAQLEFWKATALAMAAEAARVAERQRI